MSKAKLGKWVNDNIIMLVGIPLIIGIHYGWAKLQEVPYLVDQSRPKEIPIVAAFKSIKNKIAEKLTIGRSTATEPQENLRE